MLQHPLERTVRAGEEVAHLPAAHVVEDARLRDLVDGDLASNSHGWQWTAGTGTDAAPYFRVFNPITQSTRFDLEGAYIRRWVPELAHVDSDDVHAPWESERGIPLGYHPPMVDHREERAESLRRYDLVTAR